MFWKRKKTFFSRYQLNEKANNGFKINLDEIKMVLHDRFNIWMDAVELTSQTPRFGFHIDIKFGKFLFTMVLFKKGLKNAIENNSLFEDSEQLFNDCFFNLIQTNFESNPYCGTKIIKLIRIVMDFKLIKFILKTIDMDISKLYKIKTEFIKNNKKIDTYLVKERGSRKFDIFDI